MPLNPEPFANASEPLEVQAHRLTAQGSFPNNPRWPALVCRGAFPRLPSIEPAVVIKRAFASHAWCDGWRDGVYDYHHFHSTAHEVLGCYAGKARVQLGGPEGPIVEVARGDVLILPAGVAHKRIEADASFAVVGAYADGRDYDMQCGEPDRTAECTRNIAAVPLPHADPVYGVTGPLLTHWR